MGPMTAGWRGRQVRLRADKILCHRLVVVQDKARAGRRAAPAVEGRAELEQADRGAALLAMVLPLRYCYALCVAATSRSPFCPLQVPPCHDTIVFHPLTQPHNHHHPNCRSRAHPSGAAAGATHPGSARAAGCTLVPADPAACASHRRRPSAPWQRRRPAVAAGACDCSSRVWLPACRSAGRGAATRGLASRRACLPFRRPAPSCSGTQRGGGR